MIECLRAARLKQSLMPLVPLNITMTERIVGFIFILIGVLSLVFNKQSAKMYVEFQKGWGLEKNAYSMGRFISIFGGVFMVLIGLLMLFVKPS